jgi:hypothetical protein
MYLISFCHTVINQSDARKREIFIEENSNFFFIDLSEKSCKKGIFFVIKICHVQCEREKKCSYHMIYKDGHLVHHI